MKFGAFHLHSTPPWTNPQDVIDQQTAQMLAEDELGFHSVWFAEHNGRSFGMIGNCLLTAAGLALATKRVRIVTAITRLPLHHPVHLAEGLSYVDALSHGRLDWGIGKGSDALEFSTYGVPWEERDARWLETLDAVLQIWKTGRTEFHGQFFEIADTASLPPPLQRPHPPVYLMVSKNDASVVEAAQRLFPVAFGQAPSRGDVRRKMHLYAETAAASGYSRTAVEEALGRCWQVKQVHVADTTERAVEEYREAMMWYYEYHGNRAMFGFDLKTQPYEYFVNHESILLGTPDKVANDLGEYCLATGMQNVVCWFNCGHQPHWHVLSALDYFARDVMPQLASLGAQPVAAGSNFSSVRSSATSS